MPNGVNIYPYKHITIDWNPNGHGPITLEYLQSKQTSVKDIRLPQEFPYAGGFFPRTYKIYFDKNEQVHKVVLKEFKKQCPF